MARDYKDPHHWTPVEKKIQKAAEAADLAFWATLAKSFPEITSGDFPPEQDIAWSRAKDEAIYWWLVWNHPQPHLIEELARHGTWPLHRKK
jgi:hypothetical protein